MHWLIAFSYFVIWYYVYSGIHYLVLIIASFWVSLRHQRRLRSLSLERLYSLPFKPPITIIVPAYNEEKTIVDTVRSLLTLTYTDLHVIVVNDGSTDSTLSVLKENFRLVQTHHGIPPALVTKPVHAAFVNVLDRRLLVIDKENGGKSDALNAGLNAATTPFYCAVDADVVLESDALSRLAVPIVLDPETVVAVGGIVRVVNGSRVERGRVVEVNLPHSIVEAIQVVEYLRAFLFGREGWSAINGLLIISGAFGCFSRQVALELGGYNVKSIGEDMDLIVRLHRRLRSEAPRPYEILFIADPVCWTEVPSDLRSLAKQRRRWQQGLAQVLWSNRTMILNPRYGVIGLIALPYQVIVELLGPVVELLGWVAMAAAAYLGVLTLPVFLYYIAVAYLFGTVFSMASVVMEDLTYRRYQKPRELARLLWLCVLEFFPYRQFLVFWRVVAMIELLVRRPRWTTLRRKGFAANQV